MIFRDRSEWRSELDSEFLEVKNKSWSLNLQVGHEVIKMLEVLRNTNRIYYVGLYKGEQLSSFLESEWQTNVKYLCLIKELVKEYVSAAQTLVWQRHEKD
jgi:hypothetical protein